MNGATSLRANAHGASNAIMTRRTSRSISSDGFSPAIRSWATAALKTTDRCRGDCHTFLDGFTSGAKRLMRILRAIVEWTTDLVAIGIADLFHRRGIRAKPVGDDAPRSAKCLHDPLEKLQRRRLVPLRSDDRFQNLAFMVAPEIAELAVDLHKDLVQVPSPLRITAHVRYPLLSDLGGSTKTGPSRG
jgi:hypothetical protein